jgi:hypothetical protein
MPLDVISAIGGVVAAGANVREEQLTRTTHDVARRLVAAIPNLKYAPDRDLVATAASPVPASGGAAVSVHAFISSLEQHPLPQLEGELLEADYEQEIAGIEARLAVVVRRLRELAEPPAQVAG